MEFTKKRVFDVTNLVVDEVQAAVQEKTPNKLIPTFAAESEEGKVLQFLDEISDARKCNPCYTLLCCRSYMFHDANCWFNEIRGTLSLADIRKIYTYKVDVLTGSMLGREDYAYETFNVEKHCRIPFQAHHVGFYV